MELFKIYSLFIITAIAEIVGCYLVYLWLKKDGSILLLVPASLSLIVFTFLLTLHPLAAARVYAAYAAYGGVYIGVDLIWLWIFDSIRLTFIDFLGIGICLIGTGIIMFGKEF